MPQNILVTGAAGYIGGTLLADLIPRCSEAAFGDANLLAAVKSQEQVEPLSRLGIETIQIDLRDRVSVEIAILKNEVNIVVHLAGAVDSSMVSNLITALGRRRREFKSETHYFIHGSTSNMFTEEMGWTYGEIKDTDAIVDKEKEIGRENPFRNTNIMVADLGKEHSISTVNVAFSTVYGRGTGEGRKLSVLIPAFIRSSLKLRTVYKFDKDGSPLAIHVSDLVSLYHLLLKKILARELVLGKDGYIFAAAHPSSWHKVSDSLAQRLHARGLVDSLRPQIWESDEAAADALGFPRMFVRDVVTATGEQIPINAYSLGWKPQWDEERFFQSLEEEIDAVLELDTVKTSLFESIRD